MKSVISNCIGMLLMHGYFLSFSPQDWVPAAASADAEADAKDEDEFGAKDFRAVMSLRPDHEARPLWIGPNGHIFLEAFSPVYR